MSVIDFAENTVADEPQRQRRDGDEFRADPHDGAALDRLLQIVERSQGCVSLRLLISEIEIAQHEDSPSSSSV